jgi:hypothetical protein
METALLSDPPETIAIPVTAKATPKIARTLITTT